jgi:tetratricopeptide (TPR) repeat protein
MNLNRTHFLCLVGHIVLITGCRRQTEVHLKRDGAPEEIVAQFTNLLAKGTTLDRIGAARALGTLAIESWDQDSKATAVTALMRATHAQDTNVQNEAWLALSYQYDPVILPSWSSVAISNAAAHELGNSEAEIRCAAAALLLRQSTRNQAAASAIFSLLDHPKAAVRLRAGKALALESVRDDLLREQLQAHLHVLASSTNDEIRLDAVEQYLGVTRKQSKFSAARIEAEQALLELLHSTKVQMRRKAASLLLDRREGIFQVASLPLQDFMRSGLADPDPQVAALIAHFINEIAYYSAHGSPPASGTLEALNRALQDADPTVRLAALRLMSSTGNRWWSTVKRTGKKGLDGSVYETIEAISIEPTILQSLTNALHDADWNVRREAAATIPSLPGLRELLMPTLWQVAIEGLESQVPNEKKRAIGLVMTTPNTPTRVGELFEASLQDPNWQIRQTALNIWGYSGLSGYHIDLRVWSAQCDDPSPAIRESAGNFLGRDATEQKRGTNAFWSTIPAVVLRLVEDPFPDVSLAGLIVLRQISAATNETAVVLDARKRLHRIATGTNVCLKVRLARCYARSPGWGRPPDAERDLQLLAAAPESIVRRYAVAALNILGLAIPPAVRLDPDPEVRNVAAFVFPHYPSISPTQSDSLEALLQKLKAADAVTRRKAAVALASNDAARQKSGVVAEALKVLLENYKNAPRAEFESINRALNSLPAGPDYASLLRQVYEFAIHVILLDDPAVQGGVWPLLADLTYRGSFDEADQKAFALAAAAVRQTHAPDLSVRVSAVRLLPPLEGALIGRVGQTNAIAAAQLRTALVEALSDREPAVAFSAAFPLVKTRSDSPSILDHILQDAELGNQAALLVEARLTDPQPDVRQIMAAALVTMGARQSDTNKVEKALKSWEGLFTRPERLKDFLWNISFNEGIRMELPSGLDTLQAVAFRAADPAVRQLAMQTLARLLDALPQSGEAPTRIFEEMARATRSWQPTTHEFGLLRNSLLKIANGTNTAFTEAAGKLLSSFRPADDTSPIALVTQAHSPKAAERRLAMLALDEKGHSSSKHFREQASRLARELTDDSDESVRTAALQAFSSNLFPDRTSGSQTPFAIEPLIKALNDTSPGIQETAFRILAGKLSLLPAANLEPLALPMLKRMLTLRDAGRLYDYQGFGDLAGQVKDPPARQRILLDTQDQINRADNDDARSTWLKVIGKLHLAFGQPNEAAAAFQKAMRLHPDIGDQGLRDLEKALETAGRYRELALEPAPRPDYSVRARLDALAKKQEVAQLVQVANRALDGLLPAYGSKTHVTGRGEPDQVIGYATELLLALRRFDALAEFLDGALKRYPESPDVAPGRAKICIAQHRNKDAFALLERELGQRDWNWMALDLLRELCTQTRQMERYETLLRGLVAQHPDREPLCRSLAEFYVRSSRTNAARNVVAAFRATGQEAVRDSSGQHSGENPAYFQHQSALSELLELVGDLDGAIASQIEANKTASVGQPYGTQRLARLYKRAGITNPPALPAAK